MTEAWFMLAVWLGGATGWPFAQVPSSSYETEAACLADIPRALNISEYAGKIGVLCLKGVKP